MDVEKASRPYVFPSFYQYAPYFTVQPVAETFSKQKELWSSLILSYCAHYRIHIIDIFDNRLDLFRNKAIDRHLDVHEKRVFLDALEQDYQKRKGRWVLTSDTNANANANAAGSSQKNFFLVLWRPLEESVLAWMDRHEFDDVMLVESLVEGLGMGAWSWGEGIVLQALDVLEREKKVKVFSHRNGGKKYLALKRL